MAQHSIDLNDEWGNSSQAGAQPAKPKTAVENLQDQILEAKDIMVSNIGKVLQRGENLEDLNNRSDELNITSTQFRTSARSVKKKYFWKNVKMMIILAVLVLIIVAILIAVIAVKVKENGRNSPPNPPPNQPTQPPSNG